ncbi:MAG: hypothetical protein ACI80M_001002 [Gammaproteobacteria bacterium]|jgi:uncharacterized protein YqgV (UPF0045/DUF77 family)|tara:strand:+ start:1075 stop:1344 length:270 start_codon:yes stop_codon:yes gene_type:complete
MRITAEMSMYPLADEYKPTIISFIKELRKVEGLELVTNQLSTQMRGEFDVVTSAVNECFRKSMAEQETLVLVVKYLSADLDISVAPDLG